MVRSTSDVVDERSGQTAPEQAPAPAHSPAADNGPRTTNGAPRRKRRWFLRLFVTLLVLLLLLAVVIQLVLWSNLPRRLVLAQLQSQLGLRVDASSLTTGWLGNTNLREVTLALPMAEQSFLDMPRMRVKHTSIFGLLLRRPVSVDLIALENPTLYVRRDAQGRWNLAEVAELVARAGGKKPAAEAADQARPKLPEVVIDRATVVVVDHGGRRTEIKPLNLHGRPDPRTPGILWRYDMDVPDHVKLVGQVAPGAPWTHEVRLTVDKVHEWAQPWMKQFPADARVKAQWRGKLDGAGRLNARLDLEEFKAAGMGARGVVTISDQGGGSFALHPDGLELTTPQKMFNTAKVASGTITVDASGVRAERVQLAAVGGQIRLDGNYAFATATGDLSAAWSDVVTGGVTHSGTVEGRLSAPFPDKPRVDVTLAARGTTPDGPFDAKIILDGNGRRGWADMDWTVTAPNLDWRGNQPFELDGLLAKIETRQDPKSSDAVVRLAQLQSPGNYVESIGEYNLTSGKWKFWINVGAVPLPGTGAAAQASSPVAATAAAQSVAAAQTAAGSGTGAGQGPPKLTILLNTWGDRDQVRIEQFMLRGAEAELTVNGWYRYDRPSPVDLRVVVKHIPPRRDERDKPPIFGFLRGSASVTGTAFQPRKLKVDGELNGEGLTVYQRTLKDVKAKVSGMVWNDRAELNADHFELLQSNWSMNAVYTRQSRALTIGVSVPDLDLAQVGDLLKPVDPQDRDSARKEGPRTRLLAGRLDGKWTINVSGPSVDRIRVTGGFTARDVKSSSFVADEIRSATTLEDGMLTVGPVKMRRAVARSVALAPVTGSAAVIAPAPLPTTVPTAVPPTAPPTLPADAPSTAPALSGPTVNGTGEVTVRLDVEDPSQIVLSFTLGSWPLQLGDSLLLDLSGESKQLVIDIASEPDAKQKILPGKTAVGDLALVSNLTYRGATLGSAKLLGTFMGRELDLRRIAVQTLDGNVNGQGVIELERPLEARASFAWDKVSAARLVEMFPALKGLEGTFAGRMRIQPSRDPRALGPLTFAIETDAGGARYNTIQIGRSRILGYADLNRFVLNDPGDLPSIVEIAGGRMTLWGRVSYHHLETTRDAVSSQVMLNFKGLDLDQIVRAGAPNYENGVGRLDGTLTLIGATRGPRLVPLPPGVEGPGFSEKLLTAITAEGHVKLTEARLGQLPIFSFIYDALNLGQDVKENAGHGEVSVRMEDGALELNNLRYFNRGTEVRGLVTIEQMWNLPDSPISGNAAASARPLASLQLPFVSEADRILALLQNDLLSFDIKGPLNDPQVEQILLKDVGRAMQTLLLGEVKNVKSDARRTSGPAPNPR